MIGLTLRTVGNHTPAKRGQNPPFSQRFPRGTISFLFALFRGPAPKGLSDGCGITDTLAGQKLIAYPHGTCVEKLDRGILSMIVGNVLPSSSADPEKYIYILTPLSRR